MNEPVTAAAPAPALAPTKESYRYYAVWLLSSVYLLNMLDRTLLTPLIEPIKLEFGLSDAQMGLLGGMAFALFYTTLAMPLARLADRANRVNIISIAIAVWSVFTALTGLATGFLTLLAARIGIGVGEAGCNPASYSIISDYFDAKRRATALAIFHAGASVGVFIGFLVAGYVLQHYTWRHAFFIVGVPGLLLALLVKFTLREPQRGMSDQHQSLEAPPPAMQVLRQLLSKPAFRHMALACALNNAAIFGIGNFVPSYLIRSHDVSASDASYVLAFVHLASGFLGAFFGGMLSDYLANRHQDRRYYLWVPGCFMLLYFPIAQLTYATQDAMVAIAGVTLSQICMVVYLSPCLTALFGMVGIRERALSSALLLLVLNFIGIGFGPYVAGLVSDLVNAQLISQGVDTVQATADGLRWSLRGMTVLGLWAAVHYFLAARRLKQDSLPATT
ncbi:MAG TPA: MFS transporter [Povalibacter sp.]|mgnify:CR=1 FL=1|uniref:spinster family MFS transporter n=1 Tax=Povalibacter sp. TaxID=1962978 RepID=UPI002CDFD292|nr:MFS transporter [Povalibacter sp.]HMN43969.1 MFS transporter [Povalibacter sp.]